MKTNYPEKTREYDKHPFINSKRWQYYKHRPDDIVITTSYKAGTTWMQTIVANLLYQTGEFPMAVSEMAPWVDMDILPLEVITEGLENQTNRRFVKTHLPLDGIPYFKTTKYIYVGRDGRDVFMSLWNHHNGYGDELKALATEKANAVGKDYPLDYKDLHALWADWISKGWYDWETTGFPYWSHLHHVKTWWDFKHLDNIHFVHFQDLLNDPETEIRRIAKYLGLTIDEKLLPGILKRISFGSMKKNFTNIMPEATEIWKGGGKTFMNKGTNGRWRDELTKEELAQYDKVVEDTLSPDCAKWLEFGSNG